MNGQMNQLVNKFVNMLESTSQQAEATPAQAAKARHEDKFEVEQEPELQPNSHDAPLKYEPNYRMGSQRKAT